MIVHSSSHRWKAYQHLKQLGVKAGDVNRAGELGMGDSVYSVEYVEDREPFPWCIHHRIVLQRRSQDESHSYMA